MSTPGSNPHRPVEDYDVDRLQVEARQRVKLSSTNWSCGLTFDLHSQSSVLCHCHCLYLQYARSVRTCTLFSGCGQRRASSLCIMPTKYIHHTFQHPSQYSSTERGIPLFPSRGVTAAAEHARQTADALSDDRNACAPSAQHAPLLPISSGRFPACDTIMEAPEGFPAFGRGRLAPLQGRSLPFAETGHLSYAVRSRLHCGTYTQHLTCDTHAAAIPALAVCVAPARLPRHAILPNAWRFSRCSPRLLRREAHPERRQGTGQVAFPVQTSSYRPYAICMPRYRVSLSRACAERRRQKAWEEVMCERKQCAACREDERWTTVK
jgi:hypothetical protein